MEAVRIMTHLDSPIKIVVFTPMEIVVVMFPLMLGLVLGGYVGFVVAISGFLLRKQLKRFQRKYSERFIKGVLYWYFPESKSHYHHNVPRSAIREYVL